MPKGYNVQPNLKRKLDI